MGIIKLWLNDNLNPHIPSAAPGHKNHFPMANSPARNRNNKHYRFWWYKYWYDNES